MSQTLWELPVPSSALTSGPSFAVLPKRQCELSFHFEGEDDGDKRMGIVFDDVEAYKCTHMTARSLDMINTAYDRLVEIQSSAWLAEVRTNSAPYYANRQAAPKPLRHLMICFDDAPCYEFICSGFTIN